MAPLDYRWEHAVNSRALLAKVAEQVRNAKQLQFATRDFVNAVEADIIWSDRQQLPVMGHPPAVDGEVTLEEFLREMLVLSQEFGTPDQFTAETTDDNVWTAPLIVKLDFKSMQAFRASNDLLVAFIAAFPFVRGIFINADIFVGPANTDAIAFTADEFLSVANALSLIENDAHRQKIVLSVGWTTSNGTSEEIYRPYTDKMVDDMLRVLEPYRDMAVTFPLRATSVRESWAAVRRLLAPKNYSFTLWWALSQMADDDLEWLYSTLETPTVSSSGDANELGFAGRTFYDILGFESFLQRRE